MKDTGRPVISCVFAPSLDTPAHVELAGRLGYRRAWCYDSPAVYTDPMRGTRADIAARLRALAAAGITEVAYQPMGPDIPRELTAFAQAAGIADAGTEET